MTQEEKRLVRIFIVDEFTQLEGVIGDSLPAVLLGKEPQRLAFSGFSVAAMVGSPDGEALFGE